MSTCDDGGLAAALVKRGERVRASPSMGWAAVPLDDDVPVIAPDAGNRGYRPRFIAPVADNRGYAFLPTATWAIGCQFHRYSGPT